MESHVALIRSRRFLLVLFAFFTLWGGCIFVAAAPLPSVLLKPMFGTDDNNGFTNPIWFGEVPGKPGIFLVVEQGSSPYVGNACIWVLIPDQNGNYHKQKFLSLKVRKNMMEMGLIGFAFHPDYPQNGKYYIDYIPPTRGKFDSEVVEERVADTTLLKDEGDAPRRILAFQKTRSNHNGGTLGFKDGYLYVGTGDGGEEAHGLLTLLGAMLRLDVDHPAPGMGYSIPRDNPFARNYPRGVRKEIWAYGFRNPWKWSFDPLNGDLWVGDVGESTAEEVDRVEKGDNMGWPVMEGKGCFSYSRIKPLCDKTGLTLPIVDFPRSQAQCITGGYVYRGNPSSVFYGAYIFGDWQLQRIFALKQTHGTWQVTEIASAPAEISSFGTDSRGNIYAVGHNNGVIYLLDHPQLRPASN
jgi:hypothetical protein